MYKYYLLKSIMHINRYIKIQQKKGEKYGRNKIYTCVLILFC